MELYIAGGVGEHGRNCFLVQGETIRFLVDCGKMADDPEQPYPHLTEEQIRTLDAVFLTHSHADHTGALPWLYENGFQGEVIATEETLHQLPFAVKKSVYLGKICRQGRGSYHAMNICWGRTGHCAGSVWLRFETEGKSIFFSGDYTENTLVYACDPIRNQTADLAVLDCAYGKDATTYDAWCGQLVHAVAEILQTKGLALLPVPKFGRGLEILKLLSDHLPDASYFGDALFLENVTEQKAGGFWYRSAELPVPVKLYAGQERGIVFVSDPQLRSSNAQATAQHVLRLGGKAVMTGTVEKNSYSEALLLRGQMESHRYPVHLDAAQYQRLTDQNQFARTVPYHSPQFLSPKRFIF